MPPATDLARRYAEALSALRAIHVFDNWLGDHWCDRCPPPEDEPTSRTPLGAAGAITWHERGDTIVGFIPGDEGCFRIPRDAAMPDFPAVAGELPIPYGQDVVISAAMRESLQPPGN